MTKLSVILFDHYVAEILREDYKVGYDSCENVVLPIRGQSEEDFFYNI